MSQQLKVPCLGRPFTLGMLYDFRTDEIIPGVSLWDAATLKSNVNTSEHRSCFSQITAEDTFHKKSTYLNMEAGLQLSVMSGMVNVEGAAKFLHDRKSSEKQCQVTLRYISTTHMDQLSMDHLGAIQFPEVLNDQKATHVVIGLKYGADAFLVFDRSVNEGEVLKKISGNMEAKIKQIPSCALTAGASSSLEASKAEKTETDKFRCTFYGDFIPKEKESIPTTFDGAITFCKDLPASLKNEAKPKLAYLKPLSEVAGNYSQDIHPISSTLVAQVKDIMEYFHHTEVRANDLQGHELCRKFIDIRDQLSMFKKFLLHFKGGFTEKLSKILKKIRRDGEEAELAELVSSVEMSPFSQNKTKEYLEAKDGEIKQLAQLLKNMEPCTKIRYDFPDTECDLTTLSCDAELDSVVCFAFNITSATCNYLENLKSYADGNGTKLADTKEWFEKPDIVKILNAEMEKFTNLSSTTEDCSRTAYVATSSVRKNASKFIPSIWLYNRKNDPMLLALPGPPQACSVTIDSLTLHWPDPKHENIASYQVLYRSSKETKFTTIDCQGLMPELHVRDLARGIKYEFKIQAITTSGFKIESESAYIKPSEYYDIVMVGKTGQGKSTLGNTLLDLANTAKSNIDLSHNCTEEAGKKRFTQADDPEVAYSEFSVTKACKVMCNKVTKIRVMDVPGFSDSGTLNMMVGKDVSVYNSNLQIVRSLVREQIMSELMVRRIVYFLPLRGPLEKACGTMQEELKVLHHYFGKEVFNCVVVAATNCPKEAFQAIGFDDVDIAETKRVFHSALKLVTGDKDIACPPVIYISLHEDANVILNTIQTAFILRESTLPLKFTDTVCAKCSFEIRYNVSGEPICVIDASGNTTPYAESKCHPFFVSKYSKVRKFFGGLGHVVALGTALMFEKIVGVETWPGFTNSDEMCISCRKFPGSEGCATVGQDVNIPVAKDVVNKDTTSASNPVAKDVVNKDTIKVDHSNKLYQ